jgi:hypothetical protein
VATVHLRLDSRKVPFPSINYTHVAHKVEASPFGYKPRPGLIENTLTIAIAAASYFSLQIYLPFASS